MSPISQKDDNGISHLTTALVAAITALLPAFTLTKQGLFEDLEIYFYLFKQVQGEGVFDAISNFFLSTGKFEPIIFFIFSIQSLAGVESVFSFLFINFITLNVLFVTLIPRSTRPWRGPNYHCMAAIIAISCYSYFSREIYILRSMYAFSFLLMFAISTSRWKRVALFVLGTLTHASFIPFCFLYYFIELGTHQLKQSRLQACYILSLIICFIVLNMSSSVYIFSSAGVSDSDVFTASNTTHSLQSVTLTLFTILALASYIKGNLNKKEQSLALFCLFISVIALFNYNSYHLMNRIAAPAFCITPFLIFWKRSFPFSRYFKLVYLASILASLRLMYLFYFDNFSIPT